ncbi:hypothetical protein [Hyphomicrobium sp.]|uniref:hypothetical protein n=1 Tax=Hyphomicrobium sp. TaxID=82 RepID=UPI003F702AD8
MLRSVVALLSLSLLSALAAAQDHAPMPPSLVIGYEDEGKVDASEKSCRAFVVDMVEWEKAEMDQAVKDVCVYRQKHIDAYAKLQAAYTDFRAVLSEQTRFDGAVAARHVAAIIKNCIDMKWALSTGGHNIGTDMIPHAIATECLDLGRDLLQKETANLGPRDDQPAGGE